MADIIPTTELPARALAAAARLALPAAIWRLPDGKGPEGVIATGPVGRRALFVQEGQPFFALHPFAQDFSGEVDAIAGDIRLGGALSYWTGTGYAPAPVTAAHRAFDEALRACAGPVRAAEGKAPPARTARPDYEALVARAVAEIAAGRLQKVVLSRVEEVTLAPGHDLAAVFADLCARLPHAFVTLVMLPGAGAWLTGTPETLVAIEEGTLSTIALAGTQWALEKVALEDVAWPGKIIAEQALVAAYIRKALADVGLEEVRETPPRSVRAANLVHLRSDFSAPVDGVAPARLAALLAALHPTSAVLGMPRAAARAFLARHEGYDRDLYTGFIGPVTPGAGLRLFVNLRTARLSGDRAYLHVGGGIVAGSRPDIEWQETVEKAATVGASLPRA